MKSALGFSALLFAAFASPQAHAVVSVGNVLVRLAEAIDIMEQNTVQIEEVTVDVLTVGDDQHSLTVNFEAGQDVYIVGVGDSDRIVDLDLLVVDSQGKEVARDELVDNTPVLNFTAPYPGSYTIVAKAAEFNGDVLDGFFGVAYGNLTGESVVSVTDTLLQAALISSTLEGLEHQIVYARWLVAAKKENVPVPLHLDGGAAYKVVGVGSSDRVKDLDMAIMDSGQNVIGEDTLRDNMPIVEVVAGETGTWTAYVRAAKMRKRRYKDAHALVIVARAP